MLKNLERLEISPSKNGGHVITHHFKPRAISQRGAMRGGLGMHYREPETHSFGAGQQDQMTAHIMKSLGLKGGGGASDNDGDEE
jgi:hypothetical protein